MKQITITLTEADLYNHPEYAKAGYKVGEKVNVTPANDIAKTNIVGGRPDDRQPKKP